MKSKNLTLPELMFIAGTRAALGVGVGLLLAPRLSSRQRRALGLTLLGVGAVTTIPIIAHLVRKPDAGRITA